MARFVFALLVVAFFGQSAVTTLHTSACTSGISDCKPCLRPGSEPGKELYNRPPDVTEVELDKTEIHRKAGDKDSRESTVSVKTTAQDPEGDVLTYSYTVSGGRIVGTGANVAWDLNRVMPGTYTITAAVDDGCGLCGAKMTKSVVIVEDTTEVPKCNCPQISISMTQPDSSGGNYDVFTANLNGLDPNEITYNWTISAGTLVAGQGTQNIKVRLPEGHSSGSATVTVELGGLDPACSCTTSASRLY